MIQFLKLCFFSKHLKIANYCVPCILVWNHSYYQKPSVSLNSYSQGVFRQRAVIAAASIVFRVDTVEVSGISKERKGGCSSPEHVQLLAAAFWAYGGSAFSTCCSEGNNTGANFTDTWVPWMFHLFTSRERTDQWREAVTEQHQLQILMWTMFMVLVSKTFQK